MKKLVLILALIFAVNAVGYSADNNYVPGEIIVMLKPGKSTSDLTNAFGFLNMRPKEIIVLDMNIWLFEYNYQLMNADNVLMNVRQNNSVAIAQFNHYVTDRSMITPNDPFFTPNQWSMMNTGQTIGGSVGVPDADIDAPEAWNLTTSGLTAAGDTIVVCIVDGGAYLTHQDLNFWKNWREIPGNSIDDDSNGYVDDYNGWNAIGQNGNISNNTHGTHCSGIAGAIGNNSIGVAGVNWNVKIMMVQGSTGQEAVALRAYGYALKQRRLYDQTNGVKGAFVVVTSSSFGVDYGNPVNFPLWCAFYDSLGNAGILSAGATANINLNIDVEGDIPTGCPSNWLITVTNTNNRDRRNGSGGNYGSGGAAWGLTTIDLGAPGTNVYSTYANNTYSNLTGTSMATPHVAGAIGFMYSVAPLSFIQAYKTNPGPNALIVKQKLMMGVDPIPNMQDSTVSGGRLNLYNSALLMQNPTGIGNNNSGIPQLFRLYQNYPNPFNPSTTIAFDIPNDGYATLKVYNTIGQEVAILINGNILAGSYQKVFNASSLPSGIYFYKFVTDNFSEVRKMSLIK